MLKKLTVVSIIAGSLIAAAGSGSLLAFANSNGEHGDSDKNDNEHAEVRKLGSTLEVHIFDNGRVLVRGAKVTGTSGTTINAASTVGSVTMNWVILTDANTDFVRKAGGKSSVAEVAAGDFVSFDGMLAAGNGSSFTVNAKTVKDWSKVEVGKTTVEGMVKTVSPLVVTVKDIDYTVNVASDTSILNVLWLRTTLGAFHAGDKVRVYGTVNANATIDATVVRDTSIR